MMVALLMTLFSLPLSAQTIKITGTVVDSSDEPLTGATVMVKGTQDGASTDFDGKFTLSAPSDGVLVVSYIGYTTQEVKINGQQTIKVVLSENSTVLDEVVAVGYGQQKKVNMTGAVSSVKVDALEDRPVTNATNALAGLSAGLSVVNSGGNVPGYESQTIRVRGVGTLNDANPLVVIDGQPNGSISDINPLDIESISVLKDAASSAIYGSRAANGVILITTKKGKAGTARVTYAGNVSFETMAKRFNIVTNYADYMEIQNQARANNGVAARYSQEKIDEWRKYSADYPRLYPNTDWQDHAFRDVNVVQNHNVNVVGGTETVRYNMSLGFINNPGMTTGTAYKRYQIRSNLEVDIKPWITAGINVYGFIDQSDCSADNAGNGGDVVFGYGGFNTVPGMNLYDKETGTYGGIQNPEEQNVSNANPYRRNWFFKPEHPNKTRRIIPKMYLRIKPIKGMTIEGSYTYNWWENNLYHILTDKPLYRYVAGSSMDDVKLVALTSGEVRNYVRRYNYWNEYRTSDITATYNFKTFNNKLDATVLLGASQEYNKYEWDTYLKYDGDQNQSTLSAYPTVGRTNGEYTEWAMRSYFGRLNLIWDDKYMLEGNIRADGSSKFAPGHRWGWFPSISGGWRISEEAFMETSRDWLSSLKLRASYGGLGNNSVSEYSWQAVYGAANTIFGNTINSGYYQALANGELSWETTY
ncbi:MAG: SusC/RagA family TonB-linked outer membrane protein, partial [Muribaculaceae bacterium]|nr:SusC/RagA family TonB-linked outer membrane protein [Muribaculaceae bacterium]